MEPLTAPQFHRLLPEDQARYLLQLREMGAEGHFQHLIEVMRRRGKWTYRQLEEHLIQCLREAYARYAEPVSEETQLLRNMAALLVSDHA